MKITTEQIDEVVAVLDRLRRDADDCLTLGRRLSVVEHVDGFRASVRPMDGDRDSHDEDGEPITLSDPVGEVVARILDGEGRRGSTTEDVRLLTSCWAELRGIARQMDGARARILAPTDEGAKVDPDCCAVHERHEMGFEPLHRSGRCRWCYDFWQAEGVDPPKPLLEARARGQRITAAMVTDALRHQPKAKSSKKRRRAS